MTPTPPATTTAISPPGYRPDIDGLRAVAILSVVGFHAFPGGLVGGFIGVDIFFVISGFLISTIIFSSVEGRRFSLVDFYDRRIRRICPALVLVMLSCLLIGWFALLADEYMQLGKHVAGACLFISNFVLWGESGYFDAAAETKPMLHLWSLAIEEQFYILWPLLTLLAWRLSHRFLLLTLALAAASFAAGLYLVFNDQTAAFYSPASRFWELMVGSVLAYLSLHHPQMLAKSPNIQSFLGVSAIAAGLIAITKGAPFPGWWALLPTAGAFLIIAAGPGAWLNARLLSSKAMVSVGLISYPLYLWHWPLLSFSRIVTGREASLLLRIGAVALAMLLAWLTYRLVEKPIRFGPRRRQKALLLIAALVVLGLWGNQTFLLRGLPLRDTSAALKIKNEGDLGQDEYFQYASSAFPLCAPPAIQREAPEWNGHRRCLQSKSQAPEDIAIVGDSHAEHLFVGLAERLSEHNVSYFAKNGIPLADNPEFRRIFRYLLREQSIKTVVLAAFWSERITDPSGFATEIGETVDRLIKGGKRVYIVDDPPAFSFSPRKCKYDSNWFYTNACSEERRPLEVRRAGYRHALETLVELDQVTLIETERYFCRDVDCRMDRDGKLLFRDRHHLNLNGSRYLADRVVADHPDIGE